MVNKRHNASDGDKVKDKQQKIKNETNQLKEDYRTILATPAGKRFFKHFLKEGKLLNMNMTGNSWTFWNEGHTNLAKVIWSNMVKASPEEAMEVFRELSLELYKTEE